MNNRFKFRVWDKLNKSFIYPDKGYQGHFVLDLNGKFHNLQNGSGGDEYIVQQYSGIKDSNDKEIYEGDVVTFKELSHISERGEFEDSEGNEWKNTLVFWDDREHGFRFRLNKYRYSEKIQYKSIEVVGNIFENSELL